MKKTIAAVLVLGSAAVFAGDFGEAKWVWPAELGWVTNTTVEFRQKFVAEKAGAKAQLIIAADTVYKAELNGEFVYTGRFPDVPPERFYDILELPAAKKGENELKLSLYVQGLDSYQTLPGDPGIMFRVEGDGIKSIVSGENTQWRKSEKDIAEGVPLVSTQLGFSFNYDATKENGAWKAIKGGDMVKSAADYKLELRPVPRVVIGDELKPKLIKDEEGEMLFDLGREEVGFLTLDVEADEGVVVDIGHAEHSENGQIKTEIGNRTFRGQYKTVKGRQKWMRWQRRMAGRFIRVRWSGGKFKLNSIGLRTALLPVVRKPIPAFKDKRLSKLWEVSARTLELCMHEHYEDCPWREQALYANDMRNQILAGYYAFGTEWPMPKLGIRLFSRGINEDGWISMCMPARINGFCIPSFAFCWAMAIGDYAEHVKDLEFVSAMMPYLKGFLERHIKEMEDGLLVCPTGSLYWQFYEWTEGMDGWRTRFPKGEKHFQAALNLYFVMALESGARSAEMLGDGESAARWREAAEKVREGVVRRFWDKATQSFISYDEGPFAGHKSELVQALAILAVAVPKGAEKQLAERLVGENEWVKCSLSQKLYKYEAMIKSGHKQAALSDMTEVWQKMIDAGATSFWETEKGWKDFGEAGSMCHGWSAIPAYILGKYFTE